MVSKQCEVIFPLVKTYNLPVETSLHFPISEKMMLNHIQVRKIIRFI